MSYYTQLALEFMMLTVSSVLVLRLLDKFKIKKFYFLLFFLPLLSFVIGFSLRLTGDKFLIDTGFFFTEFSHLFVYLIFSISLVLGQLRYWKVNRS